MVEHLELWFSSVVSLVIHTANCSTSLHAMNIFEGTVFVYVCQNEMIYKIVC